MIKNKEIHLRCTEEKRKEVQAFAKSKGLTVAALFWALYEKAVG